MQWWGKLYWRSMHFVFWWWTEFCEYKTFTSNRRREQSVCLQEKTRVAKSNCQRVTDLNRVTHSMTNSINVDFSFVGTSEIIANKINRHLSEFYEHGIIITCSYRMKISILQLPTYLLAQYKRATLWTSHRYRSSPIPLQDRRGTRGDMRIGFDISIYDFWH